MWEFSLNFRSENFEIAKYVFSALTVPTSNMGGFVTSHEDNGNISILMAVEDEFKKEDLTLN